MIITNDPYLYKFDKYILDNIENHTKYKIDRKKRIVYLTKGMFIVHDVDWVLNKKKLSTVAIRKIDSQHIVI